VLEHSSLLENIEDILLDMFINSWLELDIGKIAKIRKK